MKTGHFYFLTNQYFFDFPDSGLMQNKETIDHKEHKRPCLYAIEDKKTGLFWLIPCSSQVEKYHRIQDKMLRKYNRCDTIVFADVLGRETALLIQNMCPTTSEYISNEYVYSGTNTPIRIDLGKEQEVIKKAEYVLEKLRLGIKLVFPDSLAIEKKLLEKQNIKNK